MGIPDELIKRLRDIVGEEYVLTDKIDLIPYAYDASGALPHLPDVVILPSSTEEVATVVKLAYEYGVPIVSRGSGTSLTGASIPYSGGIVLRSL